MSPSSTERCHLFLIINKFIFLFLLQCRSRPHRRLHHPLHRPGADAVRGRRRRLPERTRAPDAASGHGPDRGPVPVLLPRCPRVPVVVRPVISGLTDVRPGIRCLKSSRHPASCHQATAPLCLFPPACKLDQS